jgi:serine protease Do
MIEQSAAQIYDRAWKSLVRMEDDRGEVKLVPCDSGVLVTGEGHVLCRAFAGESKLRFRLHDGRSVTATPLGWSSEWGIGMAKLDAPGAWPHVELADSPVKAGCRVVTLGYAGGEPPNLFSKPLLGLDTVNVSASGRWFATSDAELNYWRYSPAAFDLNGRLAGASWQHYVGGSGIGTVYTDASVIRTLWNDLIAGKNLDRERLTGISQPGNPKSDGNRPSLDKPISQTTEEKARAASVRIRMSPTEEGFSGVIVTADGIVATCAHGFTWDKTRLAASKAIVGLPDGRDAAAKVLGFNIVCDVGLVQITDKGPWPHVAMGDSIHMRPNEGCLLIGYGPVDRHDRRPRVRHTAAAEQLSGPWNQYLEIDPSTPWAGGDSGGGVFDADGRVVALVHGTGLPRTPGRRETMPKLTARVELVRKHWEEVQGPFEVAADPALAATVSELRHAPRDAEQSVVEVLDGEKPVALGTVVHPDGIVLTEASTLPKHPACRLSGGRLLPATVVKTALENDLAVLKVEATHLVPIKWSTDGDPKIGTFVAMPAAGGQTAAGVISHAPLSLPPELCGRHVNLRDTALGLEVSAADDWSLNAFRRSPRQPILRRGDLVVSVDGHPTPNLESYRKLWQSDRIAANEQSPVLLVVVRDGKKIESPRIGVSNDGAYRYSGFSLVYSVATDPDATMCGGPVLDARGFAVGIGIAWRAPGWLLVLPAATAKALAGD